MQEKITQKTASFAERLKNRKEAFMDEVSSEMYKSAVEYFSGNAAFVNDVIGAYPDLGNVPKIERYSTRALAFAMHLNSLGKKFVFLPDGDDVKEAIEYFKKNNLTRRGVEYVLVNQEDKLTFTRDVLKKVFELALFKAEGETPAEKIINFVRENKILFFGASREVRRQVVEAVRSLPLEEDDKSKIIEEILPATDLEEKGTQEYCSLNDKQKTREILDLFDEAEKEEKETGESFTVPWMNLEDFKKIPREKKKEFLFGAPKIFIKKRLSASGDKIHSLDLSTGEKALDELEAYLEGLKVKEQDYIIEHGAKNPEFEGSIQAVIEEDGSVKITGITKQVIKDNEHQGNTISFDEEFVKSLISEKNFSRIKKLLRFIAEQTDFRGYLSLDYIGNKENLTILEVNARFTGATMPLSMLTYLQSVRNDPVYVRSLNTIELPPARELEFEQALNILRERELLFEKGKNSSEVLVIPYLIALPKKIGLIAVACKKEGESHELVEARLKAALDSAEDALKSVTS